MSIMKFHPLGEGEPVSFETALQQGLAPDGSLYYPTTIPGVMPDYRWATDRQAVDQSVLQPWLADELTPQEITNIVAAAAFDTPLQTVGDKQVLELFHGPTQAFKDVAARYLAALMGHFNSREGRTSTVLVATSGDTGGAIAHGFGNVSGTRVVVVYPKGKVSAMQQEQLRRTAGNIHTLEVDGVFDDCQELVKVAMLDPDLAHLNPTSANSISIGRLIPQITYYARAIRQLKANPHDPPRFVVPTGNLGNLTAGVMGRAMGLPIQEFIAANNSNDALTRYLETGTYDPHDTIPTMSNAMDVGKPNNFPRFLELFNHNVHDARNTVKAATVSDEETIRTIQTVYDEHGYVLDPHSAVGWAASEQIHSPYARQDVIVATADPRKFAEEILVATGIEVDNAAILEELRKQPESYTPLNNDYRELKEYLGQLSD